MISVTSSKMSSFVLQHFTPFDFPSKRPRKKTVELPSRSTSFRILCAFVFVATVSSQLNISNWLFFRGYVGCIDAVTLQPILLFGTNALHQYIHHSQTTWAIVKAKFRRFSTSIIIWLNVNNWTLNSLVFNKRALRCSPCIFTLSLVNEWMHLGECPT